MQVSLSESQIISNLLDHAYSYPFVELDVCLSKIGGMDWVQAIFLAY